MDINKQVKIQSYIQARIQTIIKQAFPKRPKQWLKHDLSKVSITHSSKQSGKHLSKYSGRHLSKHRKNYQGKIQTRIKKSVQSSIRAIT